MSYLIKSAFLSALIIFFSVPAFSEISDVRHLDLTDYSTNVFVGGNNNSAKSEVDSVFIIGPWGSGASVNGEFETPSGGAHWNGWTHEDLTPGSHHWSISSYQADNLNSVTGNLAAYCGNETLQSCDETDPVGGYGNAYADIMAFVYTIDDPLQPCNLMVSGVLNYDVEPGYDFITFRYLTSENTINLDQLDGQGSAVPFNYSVTYSPAEYVGADSDQIQFEIFVSSDVGWSDEDCYYPSIGACQVDDIRVQCSNGNYDNTSDFQDGMGDWIFLDQTGVGDFAQIWIGLDSVDPCIVNYTPQVAFIDDGQVVPGIGPSYCIDWCYGPGGYVINSTGGARADEFDAYLHNAILSPVLSWPEEDSVGAQLTFTVYQHEVFSSSSPGVFTTWHFRSAETLEDLEDSPWRDRSFVYFGGPDYRRQNEIINDLVLPGATVAQVKFTCYELGFVWGIDGNNATPAPYFDNIRLVAYPNNGPNMVVRELDLAQDAFPEQGSLNLANLASNNIRFDSAHNKNNNELNVPGDSIVCDVTLSRPGGLLIENRMYYHVQRNPVFDSVRDPAWGSTGFVEALPAVSHHGQLNEDRYAYDLPDSGFLFPGDVLHYYFSATEEVDGNSALSKTIPSDLSGFSDFSNGQNYDPRFTVNCLPSVNAQEETPTLLFWDDAGQHNDLNEWNGALNNLGLVRGMHYDVYRTNSPSSRLGNGLGGRTTVEVLDQYQHLLYSSGSQYSSTLSNGDYSSSPGDDIRLVTNWLQGSDKGAFFSGDNLAADLTWSGTPGQEFLTNILKVELYSSSINPLIHSQTTPGVLPTANNPVFNPTINGWIAHGGCPSFNSFDAVNALPGAEILARFTTPSEDSVYLYSAATLNQTDSFKAISMPYDFKFIHNHPGHTQPNGLATRVNILEDILNFFEFPLNTIYPVAVPEADVFTAGNYPNPFNPSTRISFNLPKDTHLSVKVFNVRGELVNQLLNENRTTGPGFVLWDGKNSKGAQASSGVYFYEVRTSDDIKVGKMMMIK
ncbi:MAG: T9SS type A sorting domain-containing protein [bacterium]|nr:T9SS type A sorting domain-containing protein [bacterium]